MKGEVQISIRTVSTIKGGKRFSDARFSADGQSIVTRCQTGFERWNAKTGERLVVLRQDDPDVKAFTSTALHEIGCDGFDETTAKAVGNRFNGWADLVTISPNRRYVAFGSKAGDLGVVDIEQNLPMILQGHTTSMNNHIHQNSITALLFDSSSSYLVSMADEDDAPLLWDLSAKGEDRTWNNKRAIQILPSIKLNEATPAGIDTIQFNPIAPELVTTHRVTETAVVWEIVRQP